MNLEERKDNKYLSLLLQNRMLNAEHFQTNKHTIKIHVFNFFVTSIDYLKQWKNPEANKLEKFNWALLDDKEPNFLDIQSCLTVINNGNEEKVNESDLFDEVVILKKYVKVDTVLICKNIFCSVEDR
jgi:hypothetical protein